MVARQTVGILAYGSLIAYPGSEIEEVRTDIIKDVLTPFTVEFARSSTGRSGAPTLVPHEDGGQVRAQVFVVNTSTDDATHRLYRREINAVGSERQYKHSDNPNKEKIVVDRLEGHFGLDTVLYTRIGATIDDLRPVTLARLAIESVRGADSGRDGISYLINAIEAGIETPLTTAYAEEVMRRTDTRNLKSALAKVLATYEHR